MLARKAIRITTANSAAAARGTDNFLSRKLATGNSSKANNSDKKSGAKITSVVMATYTSAMRMMIIIAHLIINKVVTSFDNIKAIGVQKTKRCNLKGYAFLL